MRTPGRARGSVTSTLWSSAGVDQRFRTRPSAKLPLEDATVEGDRDHLILAVDALIENAVDHTEMGGRIDLSGQAEGSTVILVVADSGPGISEAGLDWIFDRFAPVDPHRNGEAGGFGLGSPS